MKQEPDLQRQNAYDADADKRGEDTYDAEASGLDYGVNQGGNEASGGGASGGLSGESLGGLFPEGMDPDLLTSLNLDSLGASAAGNDKPAFDDLLKLCRAQICPVCPTCKEAEEDKLRALADVANTKKRLQREKEEQSAYVAEKILNDIIPALDNMHLALQHAPHDEGSKNFVLGVEMTLKLLLDALAQHGLEEVGRIGEAFDPAIHEAMGMNDIPEIPDNHISAMLSKGYRLKGRLLRPAKVMVCKHSS